MAKYSLKKINKLLLDGDLAQNPTERGQKFEDLVSYLFEKLKDVEVKDRNVVNTAGSEEIDIILWNNKSTSDLPYMQHLLIVECKNWSSPVGVDVVRDFFGRLHLHHHHEFGILVAASGITGDGNDLTNAHAIIKHAYSLGVKILVITREEIEKFKKSEDLVDLLKAKYAMLTARGTSLL